MKRRPDPVRCGKCNGFVFGPARGEEAKIVRKVRHDGDADSNHQVCPCQRCGTLYEIKAQRAVA